MKLSWLQILGLIIFYFLGATVLPQANAEVILSSDFNSHTQTWRRWGRSGQVGFDGGQASEQGRAVTLRPLAFIYTILNLPRNTSSVNVSFWLRVGHDSFSQSPISNSNFDLYWQSPIRGQYWVISNYHRGSSRAGDVIRVSYDVPAELIGSSHYLLLYNRSSRGRYHIDNLTVTINESQQLDHFDISLASQASVCAPAQINITAKDSSNNTLDDFDGRVQINTSTAHGDWSMVTNNGRLTAGTNDSGSASYQFNGGDNGSVRLNLSNQHAESLSVTVRDEASGISSQSSNIRFSENTFTVNFDSDAGQPSDVIAYRRHGVDISVLKKDPSSGECGVAANYNRTDVEVAVQRHGDDPGGVAPYVWLGNQSTALASAYRNVNVNFNQGRARFLLEARDVGRYSLAMRDNSREFSDQIIVGESEQIVARPFGFYLQMQDNPAARSVSGDVFKKAGETFSAQLRAVGWAASDDIDGNGIADGHEDNDPETRSDLSNNWVLPSFGQEGGGTEVELTSQAWLPTPVIHSSLTGDTAVSRFDAGIADNLSLAYSNVGIMEVSAHVDNYLGSGALISGRIAGRSGHVGRFIPDHFDLADIQMIPACTVAGANFSHLGQGFELRYTLQAKNAQGQVSDGYRGDWLRLAPAPSSLGQRNFLATVATEPLTGRINIDEENFNWDGAGTAQVETNLQLMRSNEPETPLRNVLVGLDIRDADGVTLAADKLDLDLIADAENLMDHKLLGASDFYYSRLRLDGAHGPETQAMPVTFFVESFYGHAFVKNSQDSCTKIPRERIDYIGSGSIDVDANRTVPVGAGSSLGEYGQLDSASVGFLAGDAGHFFTPPGQRGEFSVDVDLENFPWLQYDWNQDGDFSENTLPRASYQFGSHRGHDRIIYWRELLN